jgi:hypothetical protein
MRVDSSKLQPLVLRARERMGCEFSILSDIFKLDAEMKPSYFSMIMKFLTLSLALSCILLNQVLAEDSVFDQGGASSGASTNAEAQPTPPPSAPAEPVAPPSTPPAPKQPEKGKPGDQKGTIEKIDAAAGTFTVGGVNFTLSKVGKIYVDNVKSSLADLKEGDLVAVTYWPRSDGSNSATRVIKGHPGRKKS